MLYVKAPCEAEASCAALVKMGKVYATATEDMDGLTFGTSVLLRHLTASEAKYEWMAVKSYIIPYRHRFARLDFNVSFFLLNLRKLPIQEFHFSRILQEMGLTHQQVRLYLPL